MPLTAMLSSSPVIRNEIEVRYNTAVEDILGDTAVTGLRLVTGGRTTDLPVEAYTQVLVGAGLPEPVAAVYADGDRGVADGELLVETGDLERLLGRPATSLEDAVTAAVAALRAEPAATAG